MPPTPAAFTWQPQLAADARLRQAVHTPEHQIDAVL
jgi:hypothetical protein